MALIDREIHNHAVILYIGNPNRAAITDSGYRYQKRAPVINIADRFNSYASFIISVGPEYKDDAMFSFDCEGGFVFKSAAGFTFNKEILDINLEYKWKNTNPSGALAGRIKEKVLEIIDSIAKADVNLTMGFASALKDIYFFYTNLLGMDMGQDLAAHMKTLLYFITQGKITLPEKETAIFDDFDFNMPNIGAHKVYITLTDNPSDASINQAIQDMRTLRLMPRLLSYAKKLDAYQKSQSDAIYEPLQVSPYDRSNSYGFFSGLRVKQLPFIRINDIKKAIENKDTKVILQSVDTDGKTEEIDIGLTLIEAFAFSFGSYIYANSNQTYRPLLTLFTSIAQKTYSGITEGDLYDMYIKNWRSGDIMDNIIDKVANGYLGLGINDAMIDAMAFFWCNEITTASKEFAGNMIGTFLLEFFNYDDNGWNAITEIFKVEGGDEEKKIEVGKNIVAYLKKNTLSGAPREAMPNALENKAFIKQFIEILSSCEYGSPFVSVNPRVILPIQSYDWAMNLPRWTIMGLGTLKQCQVFQAQKIVMDRAKEKQEELASEIESIKKNPQKRGSGSLYNILSELLRPQRNIKFSLTYMIFNQNNMDESAIIDLFIQKMLLEPVSLGLRNDSNYMDSIARQVYSNPDEIKKFTSVKNASILVAQKLVEMLAKLGFIMFLPPSGYNFIPDFRAIVAAIVHDVPCVQLFSSTDNIEDDNVTYVISYYGIVMRNVKRLKLIHDNTLTQQALLYLLPENITIESSNTFTYSSLSSTYYRSGYPTWVKLSLTFKPMHKWIFFFGNYYNLQILYDLLETGKALGKGEASGGALGVTTGSAGSAIAAGISGGSDISNIVNCPS